MIVTARRWALDFAVRIMGRKAVLALLGSSLAACTVGPDFQRPVAPEATTLAAGPQSALDTAGQHVVLGEDPDAQWWTHFGSEALNATMQRALADNYSLAAAGASLARAQEAVTAANGTRAPQVTLDAGAGRQQYGAQFSGSKDASPFNYFSVGPSVRYLFDFSGGQRRAVEEQQALADEQAYRLRAAQLRVTGTVAQQVFAIASARAQIDTLQALVDEDRHNLELVQTAYDAGSVSRVDVLSAKTQLANDQTLLPPLRQQLDTARHALSIVVGRAPAGWVPPDFELAQLQLPQSLPLSLPSELAHRRPDILAAEARLHAATAAVGVADARLYPQITLTASASFQSTTADQLFDTSTAAWAFAGGLTAPLFNGGALHAQSRAARDAMQAALADYQQTVLESFGQVADALTALEHDAEQLAAQQNALNASNDNLALTRESYRVGNVGILQVLDAERASQQARLGLVRAEAQRFQDSAQLFLALGGSPISRIE